MSMIRVAIDGVKFSAVTRSIGLTDGEAARLMNSEDDGDRRVLVSRMRKAARELNEQVRSRC